MVTWAVGIVARRSAKAAKKQLLEAHHSALAAPKSILPHGPLEARRSTHASQRVSLKMRTSARASFLRLRLVPLGTLGMRTRHVLLSTQPAQPARAIFVISNLFHTQLHGVVIHHELYGAGKLCSFEGHAPLDAPVMSVAQ